MVRGKKNKSAWGNRPEAPAKEGCEKSTMKATPDWGSKAAQSKEN